MGRDTKVKPTLLLVSGIDGKHPAGVINSIGVINQLLTIQLDSLAHLLENKSIWIVPIVNPDVYKMNVKSRKWNSGNARIANNGRIDENPSVAINGDASISQMRVKTNVGTHVLHPLPKSNFIYKKTIKVL